MGARRFLRVGALLLFGDGGFCAPHEETYLTQVTDDGLSVGGRLSPDQVREWRPLQETARDAREVGARVVAGKSSCPPVEADNFILSLLPAASAVPSLGVHFSPFSFFVNSRSDREGPPQPQMLVSLICEHAPPRLSHSSDGGRFIFHGLCARARVHASSSPSPRAIACSPAAPIRIVTSRTQPPHAHLAGRIRSSRSTETSSSAGSWAPQLKQCQYH
jgi:hypothetical protein